MSKQALGGYRGYIGSRLYQCGEFPQSIQNMLIRNYCQKYRLPYLLSATEYAMPGCYMMLQEVVNSVELLDGIILFSIFMLPESFESRRGIYKKVLLSGRTIHAALEDITIKSLKDISSVEVILNLQQIILTDKEIKTLCVNHNVSHGLFNEFLTI